MKVFNRRVFFKCFRPVLDVLVQRLYVRREAA